MRYSGGTERERREMLAAVGAPDMEALLASIPAEARMRRPLAVEGPWSEQDLLARLEAKKATPPRVALVGAGLYRHYVPSPVDALCARSEWVTSYTPYQPELAQGTLTMYYEFQTYVAQLTGQQIANAGMYDGSTSCVEAVLMGLRLAPKAKVVYASAALHPEYLDVLRTYLRFQEVELRTLPVDAATGRTVIGLTEAEQKAAGAIVLQSPNYFGVIEDAAGLSPEAFSVGVCTEALSMALLEPPPVRVAVGDMQSFGIPIQLGGPTAGFFATRSEYVRQMPGRLVGRTVDADGRDAFCITLATREQFIRREKATSNICTSSGLMCLRSVVYLSLMGRRGVEDVAMKNAKAARWFADGLRNLGLPTVHSGPFFNEFVVDCSAKPALYEKLLQRDVVFGVPLARRFPERRDQYLVNVTEVHYPDLEALLDEVKSVAHDL
ncbi:MAG TPA: aminomethyl-transferring glycine dehydrogenase subunit GcvPA [Planctomycetota bacterium]|nr:aminomethyl-transferring glycine dehydrogenase subunit GcvPA [Planctomycetota bacterium]